MRRARRLCGLARVLLVLAFALLPQRAAAQAQPGWSDPINLSQTPGAASSNPRVLADPTGGVHVFWVEDFGANPRGADTIMYARHDGQGWSAPVDILVATGGEIVGLGGRALTAAGELAIAWHDQSHVYYGRAAPGEAGDARAWRTDVVYAGPVTFPPDLFVDAEGRAHVVWGESGAIRYSQLEHAGQWTEPVTIWDAPGKQGLMPRVVVDSTGVIHAVWSEISEERNWQASGVWYGRSTDLGRTWSQMLYEPDRGAWINIGMDAQDNLHLIWLHGVWSREGRWHRLSSDHGLTWSEPAQMFPPGPFNGLTRWPVLANDSAGRLHYISSFNAGVLDGVVHSNRILHAAWREGAWGEPELVNETVSDPHSLGESADVTISNGNRLHVVYHDAMPDSLDIWYTTRQVDAPASLTQAAVRAPTHVSAWTPPATQAVRATPLTRSTTAAPLSTPAAARQNAPRASSPGKATLLLMGIGPAALLIAVAIAAQRLRRD